MSIVHALLARSSVVCLLASAAFAQTTWTGAISTNWDSAGNWSPPAVPTATVDVIIAPTVNQPSSYITNPACRDLTVQAGATLTLAGGFDLSATGDLTITGSLNVASTTSQVTVAGNWTNDGSFTNGSSTVDLSGTGALGGASSTTFGNLTISGGTRTVTTAFSATGDINVTGTTTFDIGALTHTVSGNWTSSSSGVSVIGAGTIEFTGTGLTTASTNGMPSVLISAGVRSMNQSIINGDLTMSGGEIRILDNVTVLVTGNANLTSGVLGWVSLFAGEEKLQVNGDVTCTATAGTTSAESLLQCGGNWSSSSAFSPTNGTVDFTLATATTISGTSPTFFNLRVKNGTKTITTSAAINGSLSILNGATLVSNATVDINGDVVMLVTSGWNIGSSTHTVSGNWSTGGSSATGLGTIQFDGPGTIETNGGSIPNVLISTGARTVTNTLVKSVVVPGSLTMVSGGLTISDNETLAIGGNLALNGGTVAFNDTSPGLELIDVTGNANITASSGTTSANSAIEVDGDWTSSSLFAPALGTVILTGGSAATIGGVSPSLPSLRIVNGTKTLTTSLTVSGNLIVDSGANLATNGSMTVGGAVTLGNGTGSWNMGGLTHTVGASWISGGMSAFNGTVDLNGAGGTVDTGGGTIDNLLITSGTRTFSSCAITADLTMTGGGLTIGDNQSLTIGGNVSLTVGPVTFVDSSPGSELLDIGGDLNGSSLLTTTANSVINCGGNWTATASFGATAGVVNLSSVGPAPVTVSGVPVFDNLNLTGGPKTVASAMVVGGSLFIGSGTALTTNGIANVNDSVTLGDASASWDMGGFTHSVGGDWTSSGASATNGTIAFDNTGDTNTGSGTIANVSSSAGARQYFSGTIPGNLDVTGGVFRIMDDQTILVLGNANITGGSISWFPLANGGSDVLDVDGDVQCTVPVGVISSDAVFRCGGNWTSTSTFAPAAGVVELDGGSLATVGGTVPTFYGLRIVNGTKTISTSSVIAADLTVENGAGLVSSLGAALDVQGSVSLGDASASWDVGSATHTVAGDLTSSGANATGAGTIQFTGAGFLSTGSASIPNALVSGGLRTVLDSVVTGNYLMTAGETQVSDNQTLSVGGNVTLSGGILSFDDVAPGSETLDVAGNVDITAAAGTFGANTIIECGGNWTSSSAFAPSAGLVILNGPAVNTVTGTVPTFPSLLIANGVKQINATSVIQGDLTVDPLFALQTNFNVDIDGDVLVSSTGGWDLGAFFNHTVAGDWETDGATLVGLGTIEFDGDGVLHGGSSVVPNVLVSAGNRTIQDTAIAGALSMTGGQIIIEDNQTITVGLNVDMTAGTLTFNDVSPGLEILDVEGDVNLAATAGAMTDNAALSCAGNWTSTLAWSPTAGAVALDGGTIATVDAALLNDLMILSGIKTVIASGVIDGSVDISSGALLDTDASLDIAGSVTLGDLTSGWDLGLATHTVEGDWLSAGGSAIGSGFIELDGNGTLNTGPGSISNLRVSNGARSVSTSTVDGQFTMTGGALGIQDDQTLSVLGDANISGGVISFVSGAGVLPEAIDVEGNMNVTAIAGTSDADSRVFCAGNFSSGPAYAPASGLLVLDGGGPATLGGIGVTLADVQIASGTKTVTDAITVANLEVSAGATLISAAILDVDGDVVLGGPTAAWDMGASTHTVAGNWTSAGGDASNGTISFDGPGQLATGAGSIENVIVSSGDRMAANSTIGGNLSLVGGKLQIQDDQTLSVLGNASLTGGLIGWFAAPIGVSEVLDVEGDVVCTTAIDQIGANSIFRCAGDWTSNSAFTPINGLVELDGAGTTVITGAAPGFDPTFSNLVLKNGTHLAGNDLTILSPTMNVAAGASFDIGARTIALPNSSFFVDGTLSIGPGGALNLGAATILAVQSTGTLSLIGDTLTPAAIGGHAGGGYLLSVDGTLAASNFRFEEMGSSGIIVSNTTTIAALPNDLRQGVFAFPSAGGGSVMLDIRRDLPTEFRYIDFEDPLSVGGFNVRTLSGATISWVNSGGNFSGAAFEQDPFGLIDWTTDVTTVASFSATGGADKVTLDFVTTNEADVEAWVLERGPDLGGPFASIGELTAIGPGPYQLVDSTITPGQLFAYRLIERKFLGQTFEHGTGTAIPWSTSPPANFLTVGPLGDYADIQSAINAIATAQPVISVATGTYPSFTITGGLGTMVRIYADGSGPVIIDTTTGPVQILNLTAFDSAELSDLVIGNGASSNIGVLIQNCQGLVILDELEVHGGIGQPGIDVSASVRTTIQKSVVDGTPGVLTENGSLMFMSRGSLDDLEVTGISDATTCQLVTVSTVAPGSSLTELTGTMPDVAVTEFPGLGGPFVVDLQAQPGVLFGLAYSVSVGWAQIPGFEMVGLVNLLTAVPLAQGVLPTGTKTLNLNLPATGAIWGLPIGLQMVAIDLSNVTLRFSNLATIIPTGS